MARAALCALLLMGCTPGDQRLDLGPALRARVDHAQGRGGGVLGVHHVPDDTWWYEGAAGRAWKGGPAMAPDTTGEIASITKTFTAVATLLLVEDGLVGLDDDIGRYLGGQVVGLLVVDGHDYGSEITVRQLLHQDSGLPDYWVDPPFVSHKTNAFLTEFNADPDRVWRPSELVAAAAALTPIGVPGERWHYSDTNYVLLGLLLESVTGQTYDQVLRERILGPLELGDTWLTYHEAPTSDAQEAHRYEGQLDLFRVPRQGADWAGGGLVSSTHDLAAFLEALDAGRVFRDQTTLDAMRTLKPTDEADVSYGLGVFGVDLGEAGQLWGHDGYGSAFVYVWPDRSLTIVGNLNQTKTDWWPLVSATVQAVLREDL